MDTIRLHGAYRTLVVVSRSSILKSLDIPLGVPSETERGGGTRKALAVADDSSCGFQQLSSRASWGDGLKNGVHTGHQVAGLGEDVSLPALRTFLCLLAAHRKDCLSLPHSSLSLQSVFKFSALIPERSMLLC